MDKSNIGLIGLGVMGQNLVLNMADKGWTVSVWNRQEPGESESVASRFVRERGHGKPIIACEELDDFVDTLQRPRVVMLMVTASAVGEVIEKVIPYLDEDDIIIDGGNSNFEDTERRVNDLYNRGFYFIGAGVSGGEEGALHGASIMPGGAEEAWPVVKPILQSIAAKAEDGTPCCEWIGKGGAGHYVKMVHNGIEYAEMQLIAEVYSLMKRVGNLNNEEMGLIFTRWNETDLHSFLIEITGKILRHRDVTGAYVVDKILDVANQKGTGRWSVQNALDLNEPLDLIAEAVFARDLSEKKKLREMLSRVYCREDSLTLYQRDELLQPLHDTLGVSRIISYAQGFSLLKKASTVYHWELNLASVALIWRNGCILRSELLNPIAEAFLENHQLENLLASPSFSKKVKIALPSWKKMVALAVREEIPVPAISSALHYFYSITAAHLPANLIQAQRDFFGAHTFERVDQPRGSFFHELWRS